MFPEFELETDEIKKERKVIKIIFFIYNFIVKIMTHINEKKLADQ